MADNDRMRRMKNTLSRQGKDLAKDRKCHACGRQNALKKEFCMIAMTTLALCRYCGFEGTMKENLDLRKQRPG